jgi:hypothetical protein
MSIRFIKYFRWFVPLLLALLAGCEVEYSWNLRSKNINTIVVDGILTNEMKTQCIKISSVNAAMNQAYVPISGATVTVSDSVNLYPFSESLSEPGSYYSSPFQAFVGKTYYLNIVYQSITYTAKANMASITALDSLVLNKSNDLYTYSQGKTGDPAMTEVFLDWSTVPAYCTTYGHCTAQETFYVLHNIDVNKEFGPEKEIIYFPAGTRITRRKYSLTSEHQAFLRSLLMETEWRGGIFDVQQGNVNTNISNGGFGFFAACMVLSDSTVVK